MNKLFTFCGGLLAAVITQAAVVDLALPAVGNYSNATVVLTPQAYNGATFDIAYTISSIANSNNPVASSTGTMLGVGSDGDTLAHFSTLEGNDGEGLSFTGLSIVNFNANGSGLDVSEIKDLKFSVLSLNNVGNNNDGITVSFTDYSTEIAGYTLNGSGTGGISGPTSYPLDLTALSNYDATATGLFIQNDNTGSNNRWAVTGLEVSYAIPEPGTVGLVAAFGVGTLFIRRTFMM